MNRNESIAENIKKYAVEASQDMDGIGGALLVLALHGLSWLVKNVPNGIADSQSRITEAYQRLSSVVEARSVFHPLDLIDQFRQLPAIFLENTVYGEKDCTSTWMFRKGKDAVIINLHDYANSRTLDITVGKVNPHSPDNANLNYLNSDEYLANGPAFQYLMKVETLGIKSRLPTRISLRQIPSTNDGGRLIPTDTIDQETEVEALSWLEGLRTSLPRFISENIDILKTQKV